MKLHCSAGLTRVSRWVYGGVEIALKISQKSRFCHRLAECYLQSLYGSEGDLSSCFLWVLTSSFGKNLPTLKIFALVFHQTCISLSPKILQSQILTTPQQAAEAIFSCHVSGTVRQTEPVCLGTKVSIFWVMNLLLHIAPAQWCRRTAHSRSTV